MKSILLAFATFYSALLFAQNPISTFTCDTIIPTQFDLLYRKHIHGAPNEVVLPYFDKPGDMLFTYPHDADFVLRTKKAQTAVYIDKGLFNKRTGIAAGLSFASGVFYGIHETVVHKPSRIPDDWNQQWWDASESWRNKYKNGNPQEGAAFPGSMGAFVWTTDAKHFFGAGYRVTMFGAGLTIGMGEKRKFKHYLRDCLVSAAAFQLGFHLSYNTRFIFYGI